MITCVAETPAIGAVAVSTACFRTWKRKQSVHEPRQSHTEYVVNPHWDVKHLYGLLNSLIVWLWNAPDTGVGETIQYIFNYLIRIISQLYKTKQWVKYNNLLICWRMKTHPAGKTHHHSNPSKHLYSQVQTTLVSIKIVLINKISCN